MRKLCAFAIVMTALWIGLVGCGTQVASPTASPLLPCTLSPEGEYYTYTITYNEEGRAILQRIPYKTVCVPSPPVPDGGVVVPRTASRRVATPRTCCAVCSSATIPTQTAASSVIPDIRPRTSTESIQRRYGTRAALDAKRAQKRQTPVDAPRSQTARRTAIQTRADVDPAYPETLCQRALRLGAAEAQAGRSSAGYIILNDPSDPIRPEERPATNAQDPSTRRPAPVSRAVETDPFAIPEPVVQPEEDVILPDDLPPAIPEPDLTPIGREPAPAQIETASPDAETAPDAGRSTESIQEEDAEGVRPPPLRDVSPVVPNGSSTKLIGTETLPEYVPNGDIAAPGSAYQGAYVGNLTYIQNAEAGSYKDGVLTLHRVAPTTAFIGGAKGYTSGSVSTNAFIRDWTSGRMPHRAKAPRALVSILTETGEILARVELSAPTISETGLQYHARLLQGTIPEGFGDVSLMIEPLE